MKGFNSKSELKKIMGIKLAGTTECNWFERWIDQFIRCNSYPPQLNSNDFYSLLSHYFDSKLVIEILDKARHDYQQAHPLSNEDTDDLLWLLPILRADSVVIKDLPLNYLD